MGLQSLSSSGQVEGIGVSVEQVLERLQGGLAGLEGKKRVLGIWIFSLLSRPHHPHPHQKGEEARSRSWLFLRTLSTKAPADIQHLPGMFQAVGPPHVCSFPSG